MPISQYAVRIIICSIKFGGTNLNASLMNLLVIVVYYIAQGWENFLAGGPHLQADFVYGPHYGNL